MPLPAPLNKALEVHRQKYMSQAFLLESAFLKSETVGATVSMSLQTSKKRAINYCFWPII